MKNRALSRPEWLAYRLLFWTPAMPPTTLPRSPRLACGLLTALLAAPLVGCGDGDGDGGGGGGGGGPTSKATGFSNMMLTNYLYATEKHAGSADAAACDSMALGELLISINRDGEVKGIWFHDGSPVQVITGTIAASAQPTIATLRRADDGSESGTVTLTPVRSGSNAQFTARVEPSAGACFWRGEVYAEIRGVVPSNDTTVKVSRGAVQEDPRQPHDAWRPDELTLTKLPGGELLLQGQNGAHRISATLEPDNADGKYRATLRSGSTAVGSVDPTMGPAIPGAGYFFVKTDTPNEMTFVLIGASTSTMVLLGGKAS